MGAGTAVLHGRSRRRLDRARLLRPPRVAVSAPCADGRALVPGRGRFGTPRGARLPAVLPRRLHQLQRGHAGGTRVPPRKHARAGPAAFRRAPVRVAQPVLPGARAGGCPRAGRARVRDHRPRLPRPDGPAGMRRVGAGMLLLVCLCGCQLAFSTVGSWTREKGIPAPISGSFVIPLSDGRLGIFGGYLEGGRPSNETVIYDPATGAWTNGAPRPGPAFADVITLLRDGTVLVEGGSDFKGATWLYDPAQNRWSQAGSVIEPRTGPSSALLSDGRLLIAGGGIPLDTPEQTPNGEVSFKPTPTAEIYDPATRRWSRAGQLQAARDGIRLVALGGGGAIAAGGCQGAAGWSPPVATAEVYDAASNGWSMTTPLPVAMCGADGIALRDGRALAFHPEMAPRSTQLLDSTGLTFELGAALLVIAILLVLAYRRAGRSDLAKLQ